MVHDGRLRALALFSLEKAPMDLGAVFYWLKGSYRKGRTRFFSEMHRERTRGKRSTPEKIWFLIGKKYLLHRSRSPGKVRNTHPWKLSKLDWTRPIGFSSIFGISPAMSKGLDQGPPEVPPHLNYSVSQSSHRLFYLLQIRFPPGVATLSMGCSGIAWWVRAYRECCSVYISWYHVEKKTWLSLHGYSCLKGFS